MFEGLSSRLSTVFDSLKHRGVLKEEDVSKAMRDIRVALLEADVSLPIVKQFIKTIQEKAVGQEVLRSVTPGQMVVKIVHDQLIETLGSHASDLNLAATPPVAVMMVGLQGSGKTTSTAKLAVWLSQTQKKKVLMASLDVHRPAAQEQLAQLGQQTTIATLDIIAKQKPVDITKRALKIAKLEGYDVVLLDTAGRLSIDEALMAELEMVKKVANPKDILLVADSMTGQDAVTTAKLFHQRLDIGGIILTRIDGDARGGAAVSMRAVTGRPIKFLGTGEKTNEWEVFHPDRIAGRILGMGDIVSLVEKAAETIDQEQAEKLAAKVKKGNFDLEDFASQLKQMKKMGGLNGIMQMMPGIGKIKKQMESANIDEKIMLRQEAIISSMTFAERRNIKLLNASRRRRIAAGSGTTVQDVNKLLKQYDQMRQMMKRMGKLNKKGMMRQGLSALLPPNMR